MDFAETPEQLMLRETVRGIADTFGEAYYREQARRREKTTELWNALAEDGFLGVSLPAEYGGGGLGITELTIVCEELGNAGCPLLLLVVTPAISGTIIARFGSDEQKQRWLPGLAAGTEKIVFALTEPDAGSNTYNLGTTAERADGGYLITGQKTFISGVDEAGAMLVPVRTGADERGRGTLSLFVVPTDAPGLTKQVIDIPIVSPELQFTLFFDGVEVPEENRIGPEGKGLQLLFAGLNPERILGAAYAVAAGNRALEKASSYARDRQVWSVPIGAHQGLSHPLAVCKIELELARLMMYKAAWLYDHDYDAGEATNMANYAAAEASLRCIDQAIQVHGGSGLAVETGLTDMWWAARLGRTAPVSREMILNYVAQWSLGLPRSY
jgi:alkylation response protein AidB-like acyl-CoA dehydrogenase